MRRLACLSILLVSIAQPAWGQLLPGPHAVGYRAECLHDPARSFLPARGAPGRPVQVRVWYPARAAAGARPMKYEGYLAALGNCAVDEGLRARTEEVLRYAARKYAPADTAGAYARVRALPTAVHLGAAPEAGRFPVVVYAGGAAHSTDENTVLWEHLASHGYVVAAVPSQGPQTGNVPLTLAGLEAETRDLEFLVGWLRGFPSADVERLGAAGFSFGGAAALLLATRNPDVDAVVSLDGSLIADGYLEMVSGSPFFAPENVTAPVLEFHRSHAGVSYAVLDSLRYSRRHSVEFDELDHIDFNAYSAVYAIAGAAPDSARAAKRAAYEAMVSTTRAFLDHAVRSEPAFALPRAWPGYPASRVRTRSTAALPAPPTAADLLREFRERGDAAAQRTYDGLRARDPRAAVLQEAALNQLGYDLLSAGRPQSAVRVFLWNVAAHPLSSNTYDSLADGYRATGNTACVAAAYRRLLEVLPQDTTTPAAAKEALRRNAAAAPPGPANASCF